MSWQEELSCPLGLAPLSGVCSSHGVCVTSLVSSTSSCLCDTYYSGFGDFASFPDTDCHLFVPFGIATWCLLIGVTLAMVGAALRRLFAYASEFLVPSFQELPPIQMLILIVFMASSWLVMSILKLATAAQAGGRFDANVEAIGHSVAITIFYSMGGIGFWLVAGSQMRSIFKSGLQIQAAHIGIAECQILLSRFTVTLVIVQTVNAISFFMLFLPISPNLRDLQVPIMIFHFIAKIVVVLGLYISIRFQGMPLVEELEKHCSAAEARAAQDEESERQKQAATLTALSVAMMAEQDEDADDNANNDGSDNAPLPGSTSITVDQNQNLSTPLSTRDANAHTARRSLTLESRRSSFKAVTEAARLKRLEQREITEAINLLIKQTLRNCYTQGPLFILLMAWPLLRASLALVLPLILSGASAAIFPIIRSLPSRLTAPSALVRVTSATADADSRSGSTVGTSRVRLRSESAARASIDLSRLSLSSASASASVAPEPESVAFSDNADNLGVPSGL